MDREQKIVHFMTETCEGRAILHKLFASEMPYWLATEAGQEWMDKIAEEAGLPRVLVVLNGDGYVESFTKGRVSVKFVEVPCGKKSAGGKLHNGCQEYAKNSLPKVWQHVWDTGRAGRTFFLRGLSVADMAFQEVTQMILKAINRRGG